jgi:hypothetical protein
MGKSFYGKQDVKVLKEEIEFPDFLTEMKEPSSMNTAAPDGAPQWRFTTLKILLAPPCLKEALRRGTLVLKMPSPNFIDVITSLYFF